MNIHLPPSLISHLLETKSYFFLLLVYENVNYSTIEVDRDCDRFFHFLSSLSLQLSSCAAETNSSGGSFRGWSAGGVHRITCALCYSGSECQQFNNCLFPVWNAPVLGPQSQLSLQSKRHKQAPGEGRVHFKEVPHDSYKTQDLVKEMG